MKQYRYALAITVVASMLFAAVGGAFAQGTPEKKGSDIPDLPEALKKKQAEKDKKRKERVTKGPSASLDDLQADRDPAEVKRLQEKIRALNQKQIGKIERILDKRPDHPRKADMLFQKAELMYEVLFYDNLLARAEWLKCLEAVDQGSLPEGSCSEPVGDYGTALNIYKSVLQQFPDYGRLDEVIFRLGDGLMKAGKKKEAVSFLTRLVRNYPNSKYIPDSHLQIADFWFEQNLLTPAKLSYQAVLTFKGNPLYNYALYKLAWVLYNQNEYRDAVNTFKDVIEQVEKSKMKLGFAGQAMNDLIVSWVEIDGGWKEARNYFLKRRDKKWAHKKLRQMASLYDDQGKNLPRIEIFEYLLAENPIDKRAPDYWEAIIDAKKKIGAREDWEKAVRQMIGYFDQNGKWWAANRDDKKSQGNAALMAEGYLGQLATEYHQRAQKEDDPAAYAQAAKDYDLFLEKFPQSEYAYDTRFYFAEILYDELKQYEKAAGQYKLVIAEKPEGEHAKHCQFARIKAYENLVLTTHRESVLVTLKDDKKEVRMEAVDKKKELSGEAKKRERTELFKWEAPFIDASDDWAKVYPEDENTPTVNFVSAEVFRSHGQYDRAVPRYEAIIQYAPKHSYASYAGNSLLECNNELGRWSEIEKWGRYLLDNKIFDVTPKDKLQSAIAYAISKRSVDLVSEKKFEEAAGEMLRLAEEWPNSDLAPGAIFNAAAIYERDEQIKKAVQYYELLIANYPKHDLAPEAIFVMGAIFEARTDFSQAATYFERLGDNKDWRENFEKSQDAIYNSAVIREALEDWDQAIDTYQRFLKLYPKHELAGDLSLHIAELYERAGNKKAALKAYSGFVRNKKFKKRKDHHVRAYLAMGLITEESGSKRAVKDSDKLFSKTLATWRSIEDEEKKKATKAEAAESRFRQAERIFREYDASRLDDVEKIVEQIDAKQKLLQQAEVIYFEVVEMRSPLWTAAAAYRVGQMYKEFSDSLYNFPIPEDLPEEYIDEYRAVIDEVSFPLQEKALIAFQRALSLALELNAFNEWSALSALEMSKLEEETYPITGQPGVDSTHQAEIFLRSASFSLDDVNKRAKEKLELLKAKNP
jgi:tetratricopeptide (TPR) repeat protein